jgi:UDP:flavonoid glycosyltransferase YjiC (YdhE family)
MTSDHGDKMTSDKGRRETIACIFPMMAGDLNPCLPIARHLAKQAHSLHFLCFDVFRDAIVDTGATFHDAVEVNSELYATRKPDPFGAMSTLKHEFNLTNKGEYHVRVLLANVQLELELPGTLRFLQDVKPSVVLYDPVLSRAAAVAATMLRIPSVAILAYAGPAAWAATVKSKLEVEFTTPDALDTLALAYEPNIAATSRLTSTYSTYGLTVPAGFCRGHMEPLPLRTIVSTTRELRYPEDEAFVAERSKGGPIDYVGPLLDEPGAIRAGGSAVPAPPATATATATAGASASGGGGGGGSGDATKQLDGGGSGDVVMAALKAATEAKRPIVLASMGTVTSGNHPTLGWNGRPTGSDGLPRGLTGSDLCRGAWGGVFDVFGSASATEGALIIISLGPQADPFGPELTPPPNAVCVPFLAQVDVLKASPVVFLTHGGQNSFMESLSLRVPVVVCPTAGDQFDNAAKAEELGVGKKVDRPDPPADPAAATAAASGYRSAVAAALREVIRADSPYQKNVDGVASNLVSAGGVPKAAEIVLEAARAGWPSR